MTIAFRTAQHGDDKFMLRLLPGMRAAIKARAKGNGRSMNSEVLFLIAEGMKAKGPAGAATTSPSHGSTNPQKDTEMNEAMNTTAAAAKSKPTDAQIVAAMDDLMGDVHLLRKAAMVAEEFTLMEFKRSKMKQYGTVFEYGLTTEQVDGVAYMLMHVRDLAEQLEAAWDKAFGLEGAR